MQLFRSSRTSYCPNRCGFLRFPGLLCLSALLWPHVACTPPAPETLSISDPPAHKSVAVFSSYTPPRCPAILFIYLFFTPREPQAATAASKCRRRCATSAAVFVCAPVSHGSSEDVARSGGGHFNRKCVLYKLPCGIRLEGDSLYTLLGRKKMCHFL